MIKKVLLWIWVWLLSFVWFSYWYDYYDIYPWLEREVNWLTYLCDENANCTTTDSNWNIFNWIVWGANWNQLASWRWFLLFFNSDNDNVFSSVCWYGGLTVYYYQMSPIPVCFADYNNSIWDITENQPCNFVSNMNTWNTTQWTSSWDYAWQLTSIRLAPFWNQLIYCYNYNENLQSVCWILQDNRFTSNYDFSLTNTVFSISNMQSILPAGNSPWLSSGGGDIPDIVWSWSKELTNWAVILWLSYRYWFSDYSCYWGYSLDNLFVPGSDSKDFTWFLMWSWANIFQIFNAYSWSYLTWIVKFYDSFYSRYQIWNLASFWDYPKWLYSIVERAYSLSEIYNLYPMNMSSLVEYCDLYLNSDRDSLYTWNNIVWIQGYYSLIGEIYDKRRYYDTDYLSWQSTWSVSIDEFFESISNRLVGWLEDINDNRTWIIPTYILMVMMALILFRLISH